MRQELHIEDNTDMDGMIADMDELAAQAVRSTAFKQQAAAKADMRGNAAGYNLNEVADGIMVGKLKKDKAQAQTKVHAFGTGEHKNLARIFVAGTVMRSGVTKEGKPYTKGYIKPTNSIIRTESQAMQDLDDFFRRHITTK